MRTRKNIQVILPKKAIEFLSALEIQIKPSTLRHYKHSMRGFHDFINRRKITLRKLKHSHIQQFLIELKQFGLVEVSRSQILLNIRTYLVWLYEQRYLNTDPHFIVTEKDFPKLPSYLPRPLPADIDQQLQDRFFRSKDIYYQSLLLMRFTGLRIGELINLSYHCVREDHSNQSFLKVPLGKLNNERIVPINSKTVSLVQGIQKLSAMNLRNNRVKMDTLFLIYDSTGKRAKYHKFRIALKCACKDIDTEKPIVSHRLRHTYASSLLNAGMSLVGIMRLLGHHSPHMTLRYAALTQETVKNEYFSALQKIETRYKTYELPAVLQSSTSLSKGLSDTIRLIQKNAPQKSNLPPRKLFLLLKRLHRLHSEIQMLELEN